MTKFIFVAQAFFSVYVATWILLLRQTSTSWLEFMSRYTDIMSRHFLIRTPSNCEKTRDRISSKEPLKYLAWMEDLDSLLIEKQEPWYVRTPQLVMEIRLISLDERHRITDKFK